MCWSVVQIDFSKCTGVSHLSFDGGKYSLVQMHIHSPSEHMVRGTYYRLLYSSRPGKEQFR